MAGVSTSSGRAPSSSGSMSSRAIRIPTRRCWTATRATPSSTSTATCWTQRRCSPGRP
jgi:hypothetical protein